MNRRIFFYSLLSLSISACSGLNGIKRASGDFDYAQIQEMKPITIPESLEKPASHNDYLIAANINYNGPVGEAVDVRAPSLVLPVAASTRVELNSNEALVWFDQVIDDKELAPFIHQAVADELQSMNAALTMVDADSKIYESAWVNKEKEQGFWLWKTTEVVESMRFRYQFETKPHGRSVALKVSLIDFNKGGGTKTMDPIDQQRAEVAMLNAIIGQVDYKYRLQLQENQLLRSTQKLVSLSQNKQGQAAYLIEMDIDSLWSNLPLFFEKYGFTVTDLNEDKKTYFVDYVKPENSLWASIWGVKQPVIELLNGQYRFALASSDNNTLLTLQDEEGKALSEATLQDIFNVIEPGLSFRTVE